MFARRLEAGALQRSLDLAGGGAEPEVADERGVELLHRYADGRGRRRGRARAGAVGCAGGAGAAGSEDFAIGTATGALGAVGRRPARSRR